MFIHTRTRLFCELHRAQRWLTNEDFLAKWLKEELNQLEISEVEPREKVEGFWTSVDEAGKSVKDHVAFHLMLCASRTQYCTEIHLMVHPDPARFGVLDGETIGMESEALVLWRQSAMLSWNQRLESLRQSVNGDWVIEDRDLNRGVLLKSRV